MMKRIPAVLAIAAISMFPAAPVLADEPRQTFTRAEVAGIIGDIQKIVTPDGVQEQLEIPIGGIRQWISVRGRDRRNPILLVIHGGPGSVEMPLGWTYQQGWEDYFTVVQWDQRGAGKTYAANDPALVRPTLTIERMVADAGEVVQYLQKRYDRKKIFVLGHSWGSVIGLSLAQRHPDWLYAYVGEGQLLNGDDNERVGYANTLKAARQAGNAEAVRQLEAIAPYPDTDGGTPLEKVRVDRKWSGYYGGLAAGRSSLDWYGNALEMSPEYSDRDIAAIDAGTAMSLRALLPQEARLDLTGMTTFATPVIIFAGRHDNTTPSENVAAWLPKVQAPFKKIIWFENSAHMIATEEPGRVLVHLVQDVRPFAGNDLPDR
ncbi:alpha/beta fold hydrolase [Novacetimonas pomaceti]|nr:alpha/beta fold hydrolase [Novacetimonas pomaceti]